MEGNSRKVLHSTSPKKTPDIGDNSYNLKNRNACVKSSKYSPLSSTGLLDLTTSPLRYDSRKNISLPRKRRSVYKKLYSDNENTAL